jgi:hypothetical protein
VVPNAAYVTLSDDPPTYADIGAGSVYATPQHGAVDPRWNGRGPAIANAMYDPLAPVGQTRGPAVVNESYGPLAPTADEPAYSVVVPRGERAAAAAAGESKSLPVPQPRGNSSDGGGSDGSGAGGAVVIRNTTYNTLPTAEPAYMTVENDTETPPFTQTKVKSTLRMDARIGGGGGGGGATIGGDAGGAPTHFYPAPVWQDAAEPLYSEALVSAPPSEAPSYGVALPFVGAGSDNGARGGNNTGVGSPKNHYAAGSTAYSSSEDPYETVEYASASEVQESGGGAHESSPSPQKQSPQAKPRPKMPPPKPPRTSTTTTTTMPSALGGNDDGDMGDDV